MRRRRRGEERESRLRSTERATRDAQLQTSGERDLQQLLARAASSKAPSLSRSGAGRSGEERRGARSGEMASTLQTLARASARLAGARAGPRGAAGAWRTCTTQAKAATQTPKGVVVDRSISAEASAAATATANRTTAGVAQTTASKPAGLISSGLLQVFGPSLRMLLLVTRTNSNLIL